MCVCVCVAGLDMLGCDASRAHKAHQGMRQVIHQLQLLHQVWQDVLPCRVYIKAISKYEEDDKEGGREAV